MVAAVGDKLAHGRLQLYCVSSVDTESWYNRRAHPRQRVERHLQYETYLLHDVVPLVHHLNPHRTIGLTGCSFGAYHAMVLALRQPHLFTWCVTMGGAFDITQFLDGYFDQDCYFLNPPSFLPNLHDPHYLHRYRQNKFVLATGEYDICRGDNEGFSRLLHAKGIPHSLHVWQFGSKHDWPDWQPMAAAYLP
jgi:esterase/lipase superfamily enzyme